MRPIVDSALSPPPFLSRRTALLGVAQIGAAAFLAACQGSRVKGGWENEPGAELPPE
jgi:hypothetical protein